MRTGSIANPEKDPLLIIRKWQLDFCDGSHVAAALISFFEYWHNYRLANAQKYEKQNKMLKENGEDYQYDISLLQYQTEEELEEGVLYLFKRDTIRKGIKTLEDKGIIEIHSNPNKKYSFDKKRYFLFKPEVANEYLRERYFEVSKTKNQLRETENRSTITETTSKEDIIYSLPNLNSLETDACVREAYENAEAWLKPKYLRLVQHEIGDYPIMIVNLPDFKPLYIVSDATIGILSHEQLGKLISPLNRFQTNEIFSGYYLRIDDQRLKLGLQISNDAGMTETRQPTPDEKDYFKLM